MSLLQLQLHLHRARATQWELIQQKYICIPELVLMQVRGKPQRKLGADDGVGLMTKNANGTWSITITPSTYFGLTSAQQTAATKMGIVFRSANGSQTLKLAPSCSDFFLM